jgi:hypothetical protein
LKKQVDVLASFYALRERVEATSWHMQHSTMKFFCDQNISGRKFLPHGERNLK